MKVILFCQHAYAFGVLEPIADVLKEKSLEYIWFTTKELTPHFPYHSEPHTDSISKIIKFKSDAIFIPGNYVPFYLSGYKIQIFHGLAGEKASHFKVRGYFDLYLTQGPYFTERFLQLKEKYKNFEVIETGWSKLDIYEKQKENYLNDRINLLKTYNAKTIIIFAPTHNVSMNCAPFLEEEFKKLAINKDYLIIIKFHDLTKLEVIERYKEIASNTSNIVISEEPSISKLLYIGNLLISDTSSVVYEFLLLDKPVLTFKSKAENIIWDNINEYKNLKQHVESNLSEDLFKKERQKIIAVYHPYNDGNSSLRMIDAVQSQIKLKGVPSWRKMGIDRMIESIKIFNIKNR